MERKIILKATPYDSDVFHVEVIEQTHIGVDFGNPNCDFTSSTGLMLSSCNCPEAYEEDNIVYVRGDNPQADGKRFTVDSIEFMQRIMHAVREYNSHVWVDKLPDVPTGIDSFIIE